MCDISCDTGYSDDIHVSTNEVVLAVQALGANKASGLDGIVAEHLLYSSERWCTVLAMCLSGLLYMDVYLIVCLRSYSFQLSKTKLKGRKEGRKERRKELVYLTSIIIIQNIHR